MSLFDDSPFKPAFQGRIYRRPLAKPEADDAMSKLAGYSTSALQTGLHVLDTPGAIVRGGIGSLIGAKSMPGERTSGRDLTDAVGLTSKYDKGWIPWGLGVGAEIATDPLTYFTGGAHHALTDGGRALSKIGALKGFSRRGILEGFHGTESGLLAAGHSADYIQHLRDAGRRIATPEAEQAVLGATGKTLQANAPLGALGGFGIPFGNPKLLVGQGPTAQRFAGALDSVGKTLKYDTMLGRWTNAIFDHKAGEFVGGRSQQAAVEHGAQALEDARRAGRATEYDLKGILDPAIRSGLDEQAILRATRQYAEGVRPVGLGGAAIDPAVDQVAKQAGDLFHQSGVRQLDEAQQFGLPLSDAADPFARYAPRQGLDIRAAQDIAAGKNPTTRSLTAPQVVMRNNIPVVTGSNHMRDEAFRAIPGGTEQVNDLARSLAGSQLPIAQIEQQVHASLLAEAGANGHLPLTKSNHDILIAKAEALANKLQGLPAEHAQHGIGVYSENVVADAIRRAEQHARTIHAAKTTQGFLGENAREISTLASDAVPVSKVLHDLGYTFNQAADPATGQLAKGALVQTYRSLAKQGAGQVQPLLNRTVGELRQAVDSFGISRQHYDELLKSHGKWSMPQVLDEPAGVLKQLTSTFKNFAYPLWPASHVRNATSAFGNNFARGIGLGDHALGGKIIRGTATADEIRRVIPELPAGIGDEAARDFARRQAYVEGKVFDNRSGLADIDNPIVNRLQGTTPGRVTPEQVGTGRTGGGSFVSDSARLIGKGVRDQAGDTLNYLKSNPFQNPLGPNGLRSPVKNPFGGNGPLRQDGIFGGIGDNPALATGREVGSNIEDFFRMASYLGNRRQGLNATQAGQALRDVHFDYDALTRTEKNVLRTAIPFYTYARKNLGLQAGLIAHTPAGPLAQMRAMAGGREPGDYTPEYLAGGAAVPIGSDQPGHERYISSFGTPLEEALERFKFKNGLPDFKGTALSFLGSANPLIKAPLEQVFDTQLYSGRKLSELRAQGLAKGVGSLWGDDNPQLLAQVLANTPFTRFASTFDKAVDSRKPAWARALNLGTGLKLTDVDVEKTRAIEAAKARDEILRTSPNIASYTKFYPRKGEEQNLSAQDIEMLRLLRTMQDASKARAKSAAERPIGIAR